MNSVQHALTEPAPGGACRVCGTKLPDGKLACPTCGAVYGESNRCPECRTVTGIEPSPGLGRCKVCGALRFATEDPAVVRTGRERGLLRRATRLGRRAALLVAAALGAGGAAVAVALATLLGVGLFDPGAALAGLGFAIAAIATACAALIAVGARKAERERGDAVQQARLLVASDVVASHAGAVTAAELARSLGVEESEAELVLAELSLNDFVHARVTEAGDVSAAPSRLRIGGLEAPAATEIVEPEAPAERAPNPRADGS